MTPATSFVSKPSSFPTPWSSWTMKSPLRRSAKEASARPSRLSARGGRLRKTCVSGKQDEPELAPDEAAPSSGDGEQQLRLLREVLAGVEHARVGPLQQVVGAKRLARVREGDDDAVAAVDEAVELVLGLGEAPGGDRRPLRLERERLRPAGTDRARTRPEGDLRESLLRPDAPHLVRLPDEVRHPFEHRHEIVGHARAATAARRRGARAPRGRPAARPPDRRRRRRPGAARAA